MENATKPDPVATDSAVVAGSAGETGSVVVAAPVPKVATPVPVVAPTAPKAVVVPPPIPPKPVSQPITTKTATATTASSSTTTTTSTGNWSGAVVSAPYGKSLFILGILVVLISVTLTIATGKLAYSAHEDQTVAETGVTKLFVAAAVLGVVSVVIGLLGVVFLFNTGGGTAAPSSKVATFSMVFVVVSLVLAIAGGLTLAGLSKLRKTEAYKCGSGKDAFSSYTLANGSSAIAVGLFLVSIAIFFGNKYESGGGGASVVNAVGSTVFAKTISALRPVVAKVHIAAAPESTTEPITALVVEKEPTPAVEQAPTPAAVTTTVEPPPTEPAASDPKVEPAAEVEQAVPQSEVAIDQPSSNGAAPVDESSVSTGNPETEFVTAVGVSTNPYYNPYGSQSTTTTVVQPTTISTTDASVAPQNSEILAPSTSDLVTESVDLTAATTQPEAGAGQLQPAQESSVVPSTSDANIQPPAPPVLPPVQTQLLVTQARKLSVRPKSMTDKLDINKVMKALTQLIYALRVCARGRSKLDLAAIKLYSALVNRKSTTLLSAEFDDIVGGEVEPFVYSASIGELVRELFANKNDGIKSHIRDIATLSKISKLYDQAICVTKPNGNKEGCKSHPIEKCAVSPVGAGVVPEIPVFVPQKVELKPVDRSIIKFEREKQTIRIALPDSEGKCLVRAIADQFNIIAPTLGMTQEGVTRQLQTYVSKIRDNSVMWRDVDRVIGGERCDDTDTADIELYLRSILNIVARTFNRDLVVYNGLDTQIETYSPEEEIEKEVANLGKVLVPNVKLTPPLRLYRRAFHTQFWNVLEHWEMK